MIVAQETEENRENAASPAAAESGHPCSCGGGASNPGAGRNGQCGACTEGATQDSERSPAPRNPRDAPLCNFRDGYDNSTSPSTIPRPEIDDQGRKPM